MKRRRGKIVVVGIVIKIEIKIVIKIVIGIVLLSGGGGENRLE